MHSVLTWREFVAFPPSLHFPHVRPTIQKSRIPYFLSTNYRNRAIYQLMMYRMTRSVLCSAGIQRTHPQHAPVSTSTACTCKY
jgi:hypothetical protein